MRRGIAIALAGLVALALAGAPAAAAKGKGKGSKISGTITVAVPGFDTFHLSTVTGVIRAKKGCNANRVVRFAFFNADGTPAPVGQPTTVSGPTGSIIAPMSEPPRPPTADPAVAYTFIVKVAVDPRTKKTKGKKVSCLPIVGPDSAVTVPGRPQQ